MLERLERLPRTLVIAFFAFLPPMTVSNDVMAQTTQPAEGRSPIITNVFGTVTGGALNARRPGIQIQQANAVHAGDDSFFDGVVPEPAPGYLGETFSQIILATIDTLSQLLSALSVALGGNPLDDLLNARANDGTVPSLIQIGPNDVVKNKAGAYSVGP